MAGKKKGRLWQPTRSRWLLGIPLGGFLAFAAGIVALLGFDAALSYSNSNPFCFSCHIGMDTIVEEYQESRHYDNATGVSATCSDCHVPKEFLPKMWAKIRASKDVYHKLVGTVNLDNFEEHRLHQAERVWDIMIARDSKECRNCHNPESWNVNRQSSRARRMHETKLARGEQTCVECHVGVAHKKPAIQ